MRLLRGTYRRVLRYRISDKVNAFVRKLPLVHRLAKHSLRWIDRIRTTQHPSSSETRTPPEVGGHLNARQSAKILEHATNQPLISIVVPVYRVAPRWLDEAIRSVHDQHYRNWELILVDDASDDVALTRIMQTWSEKDPRIRCQTLESNGGIVAATNHGIGLRTAPLSASSTTTTSSPPQRARLDRGQAQPPSRRHVVLQDEDKIDGDGNRFMPFHKPDFSPEYLLTCMYTCHFSVYSTASAAGGGLADRLRRLSGPRPGPALSERASRPAGRPPRRGSCITGGPSRVPLPRTSRPSRTPSALGSTPSATPWTGGE